MKRLLVLYVLVAVVLAPLATASAASSKSAEWSGVVVSRGCDADAAFNESPECFKDMAGAKLSLYDDTNRVVYSLEPQKSVNAHLGDAITVHGRLDGDIIHISSLQPMSVGLAVGRKAPAFSLRDQSGRPQTLNSLKGTKGTVLLFFSSADWCPFCKGQLVELQNALPRFEKQGIKVAAMSYDSPEILKFFADRQKIQYPLLGDPQSKTIVAYGVLNREATGMQKGVARTGYYFVDAKGTVREKNFDPSYSEHLTGNSLISRLFPALGAEVIDTINAPHLQVAIEQSDRTGVPGSRITLATELRLPADTHVYAPGAKGYKPLKLVLDPMPGFEFLPAIYPTPKTIYLAAIDEHIAVFDGTFHVSQDVQVHSGADFATSLGEEGKTFTVTGKLDYQVCDNTMCYLPSSIPVKWQVQVSPLDSIRAPENIQHK
jgi:peroxiredoxin